MAAGLGDLLDDTRTLDLLTVNALVAADSVLIPMQAEYFALDGISELLDTIERIRGNFNPELGIEGVVLTMFDERTNLAQQVTAELKRYFGDKLCASTIPRNIRLAEAPSHGKAALVYDPRSKGAESYIRLAKEIIGPVLAERERLQLRHMRRPPPAMRGKCDFCGERDVAVCVQGVWVRPEDWLYADADGIVVLAGPA